MSYVFVLITSAAVVKPLSDKSDTAQATDVEGLYVEVAATEAEMWPLLAPHALRCRHNWRSWENLWSLCVEHRRWAKCVSSHNIPARKSWTFVKILLTPVSTGVGTIIGNVFNQADFSYSFWEWIMRWFDWAGSRQSRARHYLLKTIWCTLVMAGLAGIPCWYRHQTLCHGQHGLWLK